VNEREPDGAWTDVRSHLDPEPGYGWQATVGGVTSHFPTTLSAGTPVRVDLAPGATLSVVPERVDPLVAGRAAHGAVTYANALPQTDLVYRPALGGYKEDVVLKTPRPTRRSPTSSRRQGCRSERRRRATSRSSPPGPRSPGCSGP
jgi:hypothetical protein